MNLPRAYVDYGRVLLDPERHVLQETSVLVDDFDCMDRPVSDNNVAHYGSDSNISRASESVGGHLHEKPPIDAASVVPSKLRGGVWSAVSRVIDTLIGTGGGKGYVQGQSGPEPEGDHSEHGDVDMHRHQRPPTDAELRARIAHSLSSTSGSRHSEVEALGMPGSVPLDTQESGSLHAAEQPQVNVTTNLPISLTPMQPPPDVLAAMKGRSARGMGRPRFAAPPADIAAVLENNQVSSKHGGLGAHEDVGGGNRISAGDDAASM